MAQKNKEAKPSSPPKKNTKSKSGTKPRTAAKPKSTPKSQRTEKPGRSPKLQNMTLNRKTIAQRTVAWKSGRTGFVLRWLLMLPLALIWFVFTYLIAGYSFTALVCACLIGVLLFYNICYLTRRKFPKSTKVVKAVFTFFLCIGILVVGATECLIIGASFGDPDETCEYMLVLGAKVRNDGPSVSLMDRIRATASMYLSQNPTNLQPRFDVIEIYAPQGIETQNPRIHHMEDAFQ